ncbi:MAG: nucleoside phosphorylase [Arcobacter sp.]|uniref:nucleoside phosphorylase n=1 Tax=uncultured Arcobacter sp. TaxID=165434 RepID=UPI000CB217A5|nr:nucleoside phosphorylase [uncultured Arcobacter sp.]PLY09545.1 MAG: nucleoside phosphorylase [Arcobacter sp.]
MLTAKVLIHTALQPEAQYLINFYKLKQDNSVQNFKLFFNDNIILIVSGMGKKNTIDSLNFVFENYSISKAINIGIAGCCDSSVKIGTLFCTNRLLPNINFAPITTVDTPLDSDENLETLLVDMESSYFKETCLKYIKDIYVFKVVSDYLDITIPKKSFVIELIQNSFNDWKKYI